MILAQSEREQQQLSGRSTISKKLLFLLRFLLRSLLLLLLRWWSVDCSSGCLNVSGILSKSFSLIRFTVCLYGQGEGVGVAVVVVIARPGPGVRQDRGDRPDAGPTMLGCDWSILGLSFLSQNRPLLLFLIISSTSSETSSFSYLSDGDERWSQGVRGSQDPLVIILNSTLNSKLFSSLFNFNTLKFVAPTGAQGMYNVRLSVCLSNEVIFLGQKELREETKFLSSSQ